MRRREMLAAIGAMPFAAHGASLPVALDDPAIRVTENLWIPMRDGTRLAARLFLPADALMHPCGVVLEYLPYRKRDGYRYRDDVVGPFLARAGIGLIRVDIRGTGDSDGVMIDEYQPIEQDDCLAVIDWIAHAPWCNGRVGMRGISYGSFTALQAAAKAPPALKAIVSACGTEQRYLDDVHYRGGCLIQDQWDWAMEWQVVMRAPPDPAIVGPGWRDQWLARLAASGPLTIDWNSHQTDDAKWRDGSIQDYGRITAAVYNVAGMLDSYLPSATRMMAKAPQVPQKALIGPWAHKWPGYPVPPGPVPASADGQPGPGVDWLPEELRWWHQWLDARNTGILTEPKIWAFREDRPAGFAWPRDTPGAFISEPTWPAPNITPQRYHLNPNGLSRQPGPEHPLLHRTDLIIGLANRTSDSSGNPADWWREQSGDDARSLCFDTPPLTAPIDIMGEPRFTIRVSSDRPVAKLCARLCEVTPDGRSHFVTYALLNLTHRDSHSTPTPLEPGHPYDITLTAQFACYRFAPGSRIRVALSETWWPVAWPSPELVTLTITTGASFVDLPIRPTQPDTPPPFTLLPQRYDTPGTPPAPYADRLGGVTIDGPLHALITGSQEVEETFVPGPDTWYGEAYWMRQDIREHDPTSATIEAIAINTYRRGAWRIKLRAWSKARCTRDHLLCQESLQAWEGDHLVTERSWEKTIPRSLL